MKKILIILTLTLILTLTSACSNKIELNLDKIKEDITNLTTDTFDILRAEQLIGANDNLPFGNSEALYDNEIEKELGIKIDDLDSYLVHINKETKDMYILLLPKENKVDEVKNKMNKYFNTINNVNNIIKAKIETRLEETYQNYLIYIVSDNNEEVFNIIKKSKTPIFNNMIELTDTEIESTLGINTEDLEEYVAKIPLMSVQSNTYFILKPKEGKEEDIKKAMDEYMYNIEQQWKDYLPAQYQLVKDRKEQKYGDYLIYIVSIDNELVLKTIKESKK